MMAERALVAAKEFERAAVFAANLPGFDYDSDSVNGVEAFQNIFAMGCCVDVVDAGFHHDETFETPVDIGHALDEAELGFGHRTEVLDEGIEDFVVLFGGLGGEDGWMRVLSLRRRHEEVSS